MGGSDVFLACFSSINPSSLLSVERKWLDELRRYSPDTPIVLVGTKTDMRDEPEVLERLSQKLLEPLTQADGEHFVEENNLDGYIECSSVAMENVKEVFELAVRAARKHREYQVNKKRSNKFMCTVM